LCREVNSTVKSWWSLWKPHSDICF